MASINKLTLAEELLLITLDDESGLLLDSISPFKNHLAIAASLIMELTLKGNIDLDAKKLFVVSSVETGIPILDVALVEEREVKSRIMFLLNSNEIPDPNDVLLVGLLKAVGIFNLLLSASELARLQNRIDEIANLEEINRSLSASIQEAWDFMIKQVKSYHNY